MQNSHIFLAQQRIAEAQHHARQDRAARIVRRARGQRTLLERLRGDR